VNPQIESKSKSFPFLSRLRCLFSRLAQRLGWQRLALALSSQEVPPWQRMPPVWKHLTQVPSMVSAEEMQMLYWVARDCYTGVGTIVDGGPFLGGSTGPLCLGLQDNRRASGKAGVVHSYDLFLYDNIFYGPFFQAMGEELAEGDSFLHLYERLMNPFQDALQVHAGDFCVLPYEAGPIEILFVDLAKSWELNAAVVSKFFRHLIPGKSLVIHQDYLHFGEFWLVITMWFYRNYFKYLGRVDQGNSVLFAYTRKIPDELLEVDLKALPLEEKKAAFEDALKRFAGWQRTELLVGYARMFLEEKDEESAEAVVRRIPPEAVNHPISQASLQWIPKAMLPSIGQHSAVAA
jgi:hypothetical protein